MSKKVVVNIYQLLEDHEISLRALSRLTDINHSILIGHGKGRKQQISLSHIEKIAEALSIDDISKIIDLVDDTDDETF